MSATYFIAGTNGQLGKALSIRYPEATAVDREQFDITHPASYESVDWSRYDTFINAAAMTNVDGAETPEGKELADKVNAKAVELMAQTANQHGLTLVHISSDYVFDGSKVVHIEDEAFAPISNYGQSKADGDTAAASTAKHYILRTSWVIGDGKNFISIMKSLAEKGIKPSVVNDQIGRLTFVSTLVKAIDHLLTTGSPYGTYNCTNSGESVSWADIAKLVFEQAGKSADDVTPVSTEQYYAGKEDIAPRPLQSTLALDKIIATGFKPSNWRSEFDIYWNSMEEQS